MASVDIQTSSLPYLPLRKAGASHSLDAFDQSHVLNTHIAGFPSQYEGARVWSGPDMALKNGEWVVVLSAAEQQNILKALRHFQSISGTSSLEQRPWANGIIRSKSASWGHESPEIPPT